MRWIRRILIGLLVVVLAAAATLTFLVRRSFPDVNGEAAVAGLDGPLEIVRDTDGVPHVYASSTHDLFFGQGYVHAQDRFWQMDFWRHVSGGRTAELFGEDQVETDAFLRTLGWGRLGDQEYAEAPPELKGILDAYTAGVNAYLAEHRGSRLSLEYAVLGLQNRGYEPEPWTPAQTLASRG